MASGRETERSQSSQPDQVLQLVPAIPEETDTGKTKKSSFLCVANMINDFESTSSNGLGINSRIQKRDWLHRCFETHAYHRRDSEKQSHS